MPQTLVNVPVVFLDGTTATAIATGNNAAWHCRCEALLIGRSGMLAGVTEGYRVDCACNRSYFVAPQTKNQDSVSQVNEV